MELPVVKLHPEAKLPAFAHTPDAGMDLYCVEDTTIPAGSWKEVHTGIAVGIKEGYVGLIWDKSGLARKHGITVLGGVVDAGYTGELMILLHNISAEDHHFSKGDKITQMLIQKVEHPHLIEVSELSQTQRGTEGFGSTGK